MSGYPAEWGRRDVEGAAAALTAAGVTVTGSDKRAGTVDFVLAGRPCQLSQFDAYQRGNWIQARFPWPARWPDILLIDPDHPDNDGDEAHADPRSPAGFMLYSSDLPAARTVVGAAFAIAAREPRVTLRMQRYAGASLESGSKVALNAATATWIVGLLGTLLAGAPPVSDDDVSAQLLADEDDDPDGKISGERTAVLHRMLFLIRAGLGETVHVDAETEPAAVELTGHLDRWIAQSAELAGARASGAPERAVTRASEDQVVTDISAALQRREFEAADGADSSALRYLTSRLGDLVAQVARWDEPDTRHAATPGPVALDGTEEESRSRRWWRRKA